MTDIYDVLVEVAAYGICSPYNFHSYRRSRVLLPCVCQTCKQTMYPIISTAVSCVRCHAVVHRGICMRSRVSDCPNVNHPKTMKRKSAVVKAQSSKQCNISMSVSPLIPETSVIDNEQETICINSATLKEPISIPAPGSIDCIWSKNLQLLVNEQSTVVKPLNISLLSRSYSSGDEFLRALDLAVPLLLNDATSFPGRVCSSLHTVYLNTNFGHDRKSLEHARECLDAITCAVLSVLPLEITAKNCTVTETVSRIVDQHVLGLSHRAMYCKVFLTAQLISDADDKKLSSLNFDGQKKMNDLKVNYDSMSKDMSASYETAKATLISATEMTSPRDKVSQLRKALQIISRVASMKLNSIPGTPSSGSNISGGRISPTNSDSKIFLDSTPIEHGVEGIATGSMLGNENYTDTTIAGVSYEESPVDADALLEMVTHVILSTIITHEGNNAEMIKIFWFAECAYIESMTKEGDWTLGIESYALATVMQALQSIIR